jgi:hypothetical protein
LQNYFRKLSFLKNNYLTNFMTQNIYSILHIIFEAVAIKTFAGVGTGGGGGDGAGGSYELDAARNNQNMFLFLILDLSGGFSLKA